MARPHPGVNFPPPLIFVVPLGAGVLTHRYWPLPLLPASSRGIGVALGWLLIAFWAFLFAWALLTFARSRTTIVPNRPAARLVVGGPYALTRNPMYLSMASLYLGIAVLVNTGWPLILFPGVILLMQSQVIRKEERYLEDAFGLDYRAYRSRVRRWL